MSTTLLGQLNLREGRMPNYAASGKVVSPYTRLDQYQQAQETARRNAKQKAVQVWRVQRRQGPGGRGEAHCTAHRAAGMPVRHD